VTEAMNSSGEQFGTEQLAVLIKGNADSSAQDLVRVIRKTVSDFSNGQSLKDDATIIVGKVNG